MDEDLIRNDPNAPKVLAALTITVLSLPNGATQTKCDWQGEFTEINARFMLSKAGAILEEFWKSQNAPRVVAGANGMPIADKVKRLFG